MNHIDDAVWQLLCEGRLGEDELAALMEHLEECPKCQARYMDAITPRFEELAELLMADDFTARTMQELQESVTTTVIPKTGSLPRSVVKSRLTPAKLLHQQLVAYAVAASLTMALMIGGAFTRVSSLPGPHLPPTGGAATLDLPLAPRLEALGPLLPPNNVIPSAQQPFRLPPLRQLVERSITHDSKK